MIQPPHPKDVLKDTINQLWGLSIQQAAKKINVSFPTLLNCLNGHRPISPNLAMKLEIAGAKTAIYWMNVQKQYNLYLKKNNLNFPKPEKLIKFIPKKYRNIL